MLTLNEDIKITNVASLSKGFKPMNTKTKYQINTKDFRESINKKVELMYLQSFL